MTSPEPSGPIRRSVDKLLVDLKGDTERLKASGSALGEAVTSRVLPVVRAAGATPRAAGPLREAILILAAYRWHAVRAAAMSAEAARAEREALDRRCAERIYRMCIESRGAILKLGQFISTRRDLLPPAYVDALSRLQDAVPPVAFDLIAERVKSELGAPIERLFRAFDPEPLAAGSLAQVHAAVLPDGTRVAVKVQVPGVETQVEADLSLLAVIAGAVKDLVPSLNLVPITAELGRAIRRELDFRREADNARQVAADMASDPSVTVPRVHDALSSTRVLTLDRVDGERLTDFLDRGDSERGEGKRGDGERAPAPEPSPRPSDHDRRRPLHALAAATAAVLTATAAPTRSDPEAERISAATADVIPDAARPSPSGPETQTEAAPAPAPPSAPESRSRSGADRILATLVRTYATQILRTGRFQADPHPGNFLVDTLGRLALLDFGSIHELEPEHRRTYAALTAAIISRDRPRTTELMATLGFALRNGGDPSALIQFADLLMDAFRPAPDRPLAEIDPRTAFEEALSLGRRSPILIPEHFVQIGRVLTAIAGLILSYRPTIDLWPLLAPALFGHEPKPEPPLPTEP